MQNSELVMKIDATIMATASSPIQGSHGVGEKALCLSPQLEIKSGGDDAVAPKGNDEVGQKPTLVGVSHKRKASTETNPFCESDPNSSNDSKRFKSSSVSTPNVEQQKVDEEMRPQGKLKLTQLYIYLYEFLDCQPFFMTGLVCRESPVITHSLTCNFEH